MPDPSEPLRPGEEALRLPDRFDAGLHFIGRIHTPWTRRDMCPRNGRTQDAVCSLEVLPDYRAALAGVDGASHLIVLYWMHEARRDLAVQAPRHHAGPRGTFSVRSPARPNPIALSVVDLLSVADGSLQVRGLDCLDGTPLLDIKPYYPSLDCHPDATIR